MEPQKVGRYEIKHRLGHGGMATVYQAHDPYFDREVAVKVMPREFLHDPTFRSRFEREAKTIAALEHPAIVPVYDFGEENSQPYLVMRLMTGGSLADLMAQGPMALDEAVAIIERIGPALAAAHASGVIHRDVKPGNILLDQHGNLYIADFGIVKLTETTAQLTGSGIIGTPAYMAPEMSQPGGLSPRIDIYALGAMFFQMLTGRLPFLADTPVGMLMAHLNQPVPDVRQLRPDLPAAVQRIIERGMAKDPDQRYQTISAFVTDLRAVVASGRQRETTADANISPNIELLRPLTEEATSLLPAAPPGGGAAMTHDIPRPAAQGSRKLLWIGGTALAALFIAAGGLGIAGLVSLGQVIAGFGATPAVTSTPSPENAAGITPTAVTLIPTGHVLFGTVDIRASGETLFGTLEDGQPLSLGDTIRTSPDGAALLKPRHRGQRRSASRLGSDV